MPNVLDNNGLQIQTIAEIISELINGAPGYPGLATIYPNANTNPNSPDGAMIYVNAEAKLDVLEQAATVFSSMDPDQAFGTTLDDRCAINGVVRYAGTYTQQSVQVTVNQAVTLLGLSSTSNPFTVQDINGNQYQLINNATFVGAGTQTIAFEAAVIGPISSLANTITQVATATLGVTSVNNSSGPSQVGQAEETDAALRLRRANSVELTSKGYLAGLLAGILSVPGVTSAAVYENVASTANSYGMPPHSIWCIVAGGASAAIAEAIYIKRNAGVDTMNRGQGGAGTVTLSGSGIGSIAVANAGSGYDNAPTVLIVGTGTGATATASVNSAGQITGFTVTNAGTGYTGTPVVQLNPNTITTDIVQADGTEWIQTYDVPTNENLYIEVTVHALTGSIVGSAVQSAIASNLSYGIGQPADASAIVVLIKSLFPTAAVEVCQVSPDNSTWTSLLSPTSVNYQFAVATGRITVTVV